MLSLTLTAELNGVTDLRPLDTPDNPYHYTFTVQCTSCRETHPNPITVDRHSLTPLSGSRGEAHFVWRCKNCKREHSANVKDAPSSYKATEPPTKQTIITFDCRGLEFLEFSADGEWVATGAESGTEFKGVELADGEWFDYDEKAGEEVSIKDVVWEIRRA